MSDGHRGDLHTQDSWRIFRYLSEFVESFDLLGQIGPAVTMFGSASITVTGTDVPASVKTRVIPTLRPIIPIAIALNLSSA